MAGPRARLEARAGPKGRARVRIMAGPKGGAKGKARSRGKAKGRSQGKGCMMLSCICGWPRKGQRWYWG